MKCVLFLVVAFLSLNSWATEAPKRTPTPNHLPSGVCVFKTKPIVIPKTFQRLFYLEVYTLARGTGCLKGQNNSVWNSCDLREGEEAEGKDPRVDILMKFHDTRTLKKSIQVHAIIDEFVDLGWITDRKGFNKSIIEHGKALNVDINGVKLNIVTKRIIKDLNKNKIITEIYLYLAGDAEKKIKSKYLTQARCESEFTDKNFTY